MRDAITRHSADAFIQLAVAWAGIETHDLLICNPTSQPLPQVYRLYIRPHVTDYLVITLFKIRLQKYVKHHVTGSQFVSCTTSVLGQTDTASWNKNGRENDDADPIRTFRLVSEILYTTNFIIIYNFKGTPSPPGTESFQI